MILKANNLTKSYAGKSVVKDVSLNLEQGEIVGLLGPNGAGKTTSFYMIVGIICMLIALTAVVKIILCGKGTRAL